MSTRNQTTTHQNTHEETSQNYPLHHGYILAVEAALSTRELAVTVVDVGGVAVWHADLELSTKDRQTAVLLRWDELNGWTCQTRGAVPEPVHVAFGVSAVPPPAQVADWVESVLAHPHVRPRRARGGPFVTPDLTAQLERYSAPNAT